MYSFVEGIFSSAVWELIYVIHGYQYLCVTIGDVPWYPLEEEMEIHSSTLAWKIPWMEEPGGL